MTDLTPNPDDRSLQEAQLERLIGGALKSQPLRRAPASLETRVLARIEQQMLALPWWRAGFAHWPVAARVAMVVALLAVTGLTVHVVIWLFQGPTPINETVESSVTWARSTATMFSMLLDLCISIFYVIPARWITLGLAFGAGMYFLLFALGATAYRTLYLNK
jgi:hypothetical protein